MKYEETAIDGMKAVAVLVIVFVVLYSPWSLGMRELFSQEGKFAAMAIEMDLFRPSAVAHGEMLSYYYPLFPWLSALFYKAGVGVELGLRLVSVLSLAVLGLAVFEAGRRSADTQSGVVACAFVISTMIAIEKAVDGYPDALGGLLIFLAWLAWFTYGAARNSWNSAWIVSCFFCGMAFYSIGWVAIFYFFFPLIFMERPLTIWQKLRLPGFFCGLTILLLFVMLWGWPRWFIGTDIPFKSLPFSSEMSTFDFKSSLISYVVDAAVFPFAVAWFFMPWSVIAWTPFCVAFHPLDKNPIFSRFLRTIFISLFFLFCLSPFTQTRDLLLLLPPLAVLSGMNYWLLVRRHGVQLMRFVRWALTAAVVVATAVFVILAIPARWWNSLVARSELFELFPNGLGFLNDFFIKEFGLVQVGVALLFGMYLLKTFKKGMILWTRLLAVCGIFATCHWALIVPYKSQPAESRKVARAIVEALGKKYSPRMVIYKAHFSDLYLLGCYLGCGIKRIHNLKELPPNEKSVYLLSFDAPALPERRWAKLSLQYYKEKDLYLWEGVLPGADEKK